MSIEPEKLYEKILPSIKADFGHIGVEADLEDATWNIVNILEDVLIHRTITTVEELTALAVGSIIMMTGVRSPFLLTSDGWESSRFPGKPVWDYTNANYLPATVLHEPTV